LASTFEKSNGNDIMMVDGEWVEVPLSVDTNVPTYSYLYFFFFFHLPFSIFYAFLSK